MAIDTQLKRMSAVGSRRLPWMRRFTPSPDASVDQADRQHVAFVYRGIAAGSPASIVAGPYRVNASQFYTAGSKSGQKNVAGSKSGQKNVAGSQSGQMG